MKPLPQQIRDIYPFENHFLEVDGHRMHYLDEGEGEVVLMFHGNPTWSFYYRNLVLGLRPNYRCIAPDHIGCGLSEKPQIYPYTLKQHIDNFEKLADHLELDEFTLMVHDWGGAIGFGFAARHPERILRLVVLNTAAIRGVAPRRIRFCRIPYVGALAVRTFNGFARGAIRLACHKHERMTREVRRGYLLPYDSYRSRVAVYGFVRDIPTDPIQPTYRLMDEISNSLSQFRDRPMIIFWGMRDFCFNETFLDRWIEYFPDAAVHRFEDAGHYVLEDAHEFILPALREFLDETS